MEDGAVEVRSVRRGPVAETGWQTQVTTKSGKSFVTLQREGAEGLIWARPATGEGVSGKALQ